MPAEQRADGGASDPRDPEARADAEQHAPVEAGRPTARERPRLVDDELCLAEALQHEPRKECATVIPIGA